MWKERNERGVIGNPPCDGCEHDPEQGSRLLMGENICAARIYQHVRNQTLLYFNGEANRELDINHVAVWSAIDHFPGNIKDPFAVFEMIVGVYHHFLRERNAANE